MDLLPKVFRTEGDMVKFDPDKIFKSIIKETDMSEEDAKNVTELVVRRIISSGIKFLSGPHIREIVCSILSENHFEQERKIYTRIGMPVMDYEDILEKGPKVKKNILFNPEKIHHWAANQLAEEYTLLRILNDEESKAHLYGDIYIHQLKYFDLRPYEQNWDPRIILKFGLPPLQRWNLTTKSGPPKNLHEAILQLSNWLGYAQTELCGKQNFYFLNLFLAPFARNLSLGEIKRDMKNFIHQINHIAMIVSKNILKASLYCIPAILPNFKELPAIGPEGKILGVYDDYEEECLNIFTVISETLLEGDYNKNKYLYPEQKVFYNENWLEHYESYYLKLFEGIRLKHYPHFINQQSDWLKIRLNKITNNTSMNHGILQKISLNLPRYAYMGRSEDKFMDVLTEKLKLCFEILNKKYRIIKKRLESNHLPFLSGFIDGDPLFELDRQDLCISFIGLNEAVKILTKSDLDDSSETYNFGKSILIYIKELCKEASNNSDKKFNIIEDTNSKAINRFIRLDLNHFPEEAKSYLKQEKHIYTNSSHFSDKSKLKLNEHLLKQGEFQAIIQNGVLDIISISKYNLDTKNLKENLKFVSKDTRLSFLKFIP
jgi:ribonucleoside-triphosphate reductase